MYFIKYNKLKKNSTEKNSWNNLIWAHRPEHKNALISRSGKLNVPCALIDYIWTKSTTPCWQKKSEWSDETRLRGNQTNYHRWITMAKVDCSVAVRLCGWHDWAFCGNHFNCIMNGSLNYGFIVTGNTKVAKTAHMNIINHQQQYILYKSFLLLSLSFNAYSKCMFLQIFNQWWLKDKISGYRHIIKRVKSQIFEHWNFTPLFHRNQSS